MSLFARINKDDGELYSVVIADYYYLARLLFFPPTACGYRLGG